MSTRTTCANSGGVNRWGKPCRSVFISRVTGLCRSHDTGQVNQVHQARIQGGRKSRSNRLSKRMLKLVEMLFGDVGQAPTLDRIEPRPWNKKSADLHILKIEGQRAVLDGKGPGGTMCFNHYDCQDQSLFAQAMRMLRIIEGNPDDEGKPTYIHTDTGTIIPQSEIAKIVKLVRER